MGETQRCACCDRPTLDERGQFEICRVCGWEDDPLQADEADLEGGANAVSLHRARRNFAMLGIADPERRAGPILGPPVRDSVHAFVQEAHAYCTFVERAASLELPARLAATRLRLLALYAAALGLPEHAQGDDLERVPWPAVPNDWRGFAEHEIYWEQFDPYIEGDTCAGSLSDDVLDVYRDVRTGLELWSRGRRGQAIWQWRFYFDTHWGEHAVDALRALHRACKIW